MSIISAPEATASRAATGSSRFSRRRAAESNSSIVIRGGCPVMSGRTYLDTGGGMMSTWRATTSIRLPGVPAD
jgi:hypothetical protein